MKPVAASRERLPLILFEDEHLLVIHKPAGLNTHAPSPYAGEGIYDWLRHREPRWAPLAIMHRLDKETSGVMVFAKTALANRSLTEQFTARTVRKQYLLLTDRRPPRGQFTARSHLLRQGSQYVSGPARSGSVLAETRFAVVSTDDATGQTLVLAEPLTGRTHQIRVHAAEHGIPILGDALYGGTAASRLGLHAQQLTLRHPATGRETVFTAATTFPPDARTPMRQALLDPALTNACRLVHGAADGAYWRGWYGDRLGEYLLLASEALPDPAQPGAASRPACWPSELPEVTGWMQSFQLRGVHGRKLERRIRGAAPAEASPRLICGTAAPGRFVIRENGVEYELSFSEGGSVGLFLDQRDNRRRLLVNHVAAGFPLFPDGPAGARVLNTFAYTCGFSVCAAVAGAHTISLDLSRKYLEWGRRNFALNGLDTAAHDFICGDAFDWLRRLAKKQRQFELVILDPPTFSQSRQSGAFRAEKDYGKLVAAALPVLRPGGVLFASSNAATLWPEAFLELIDGAVRQARRNILQRHYAPQPPDFPISRDEPAYLKTAWLRVG